MGKNYSVGQKKSELNPKKETILNDAEASALLGRPMNNEWKITL